MDQADSDTTASFLEQILDADGIFAYINVFLLLVAGALGLPVPEDLCLIFAGGMVQAGKANIYVMAVVSYLGVLLGDILLFRAGRLAGPAMLRRRWIRRHLTVKRLKWIRHNLESRSMITIFIARHIFYVRTVTFLVCGALRMDFWRFLAADAFAALVTVPAVLAIGYFGAQELESLINLVDQLKYLIVGIIIAIGLTFYVVKRVRQLA